LEGQESPHRNLSRHNRAARENQRKSTFLADCVNADYSAGRVGTLGRNTFRGPAYYDFDFALVKTTPIGHRESGLERADLQFRAELFILFNIVNMGLPANIIEGTWFGMISKTAGTSRQIQFSLKFIY